MAKVVNAVDQYKAGYWEVTMFDGVGSESFSEVMIPVQPTEGMIIDCSDSTMEMQFRIVEIINTYDCEMVDAVIEWE